MKSFLLIVLLCASACSVFAQADTDYSQLVANALDFLKAGELDKAQEAVQQAISLNSTNYQAYAVAAKIASKQGNSGGANNFIQKALEQAPDDQKDKVRELAQQIQSASSPSSPTPSDELSDEDRLTLNVLMRLLKNANDADKAGNTEDKIDAFREFLSRSSDFVKAHPYQTNIWVMRAFAAIDLNQAHDAWNAGQHLKALGLMHSNDPKISDLFVDLELKGWLDQEPKAQGIVNNTSLAYEQQGTKVGDVAPAFEGTDQNGQLVKSSDIIGKKIVLLYFYPKDFTGGCTKEACGFRDRMSDLQRDNVEVIGVSFDTTDEHKAFEEKYNLNFTLLADPNGKIVDAYGARLGSRNMSRRVSFLIGLDGKIVHVTDSGNPQTHFAEMQTAIDSLQNN